MNFLWEAWLGAFTETEKEAIINTTQGKTCEEYKALLRQAFTEMHRVLKPGRWLTVVFHNSSSRVWSAIQASLSESGFAIEAAQTLDKRHGTFKQFVSENAVGYDLVLHCRKSSHDAPVACARVGRVTRYSAVQEFLKRALAQNPHEFVVRYLHVKRQDEIDSRKLYSLWLREQLESEDLIDVDYEDFRQIVNRISTAGLGDRLLDDGMPYETP